MNISFKNSFVNFILNYPQLKLINKKNKKIDIKIFILFIFISLIFSNTFLPKKAFSYKTAQTDAKTDAKTNIAKPKNIKIASSSITLLDNANEKITPKFEDILTQHEKIKVITKKGIKKYSELSFPFSLKNQKLKIYFIKIIKPTGKTININLKDLKTVTAPFNMNDPMFSNRLLKTIRLPNISKNSIIDYKFKTTTIKPYMKNNFFTEDYFGGLSPVKKSVYLLTIPAGIHYKYAEYGLSSKPEIKKTNKTVTLKWIAVNRKKITPENFGPGESFIVPHVMVSSVKSWNDVAKWYSTLTNNQIMPDKKLKNFIKKLTHSKKSESYKIKAIYNFVAKKIRYVGYEFGIGGYKPSNINKIFKNRLGDCKDHATLFMSMLRSIGVKAYPVLIPTVMIPDMNPALPTPFVFDHEITAIKINGDTNKIINKLIHPNTSKTSFNNNKYFSPVVKVDGNFFLFADTTSNVTTFGDLPPMDQGRNVLIVMHNKGLIAKTPIFPPAYNDIIFRENASINKKGVLTAKTNAVYTGAYDMYKRYVFTSISKRQKLNKILKNINSITPKAILLHYSIKNAKSMDKPFIENIAFKAKKYAAENQKFFLIRLPIRIRTILSKIAILKKRKYPLKLGYNFSETNIIKLNIPNRYTIVFEPPHIDYSNKIGFFSADYKIKNNSIFFHSLFNVNGYKISKQDYPSARKLFNKTIKYLSNQILIAKK
ncbi:MAG: DUF3857 domain-containing transglutaminase family protein [bacterium]